MAVAEFPTDLTMIAALRRELVRAQADLAEARDALRIDDDHAEGFPNTARFWRARWQEAHRQLMLEREQRIRLETAGDHANAGH